MSSEPTGKLGLGATLDDRFHVEEVVIEGSAYRGKDQAHGTSVVLQVVPEAHAKALQAAIGVSHQHLASVLAVAEHAGEHVLITEHVTGKTLAQLLAEIGKKSPVDAVRTALRVADVLTSLHEKNAVHGLVHPASIVILPESRTAPVLAFAPVSGSAPRAPDGKADAPGAADDAWAAGALLHWMLVGSAPPSDGYEGETPLLDAGVVDNALRKALFHSLARDDSQRSKDMRPLRRELARWFVDHAAEESIPPGRHSREPPPFPPSQAPDRVSAAPARTSLGATSQPLVKAKSNHLGAFALAGIGLGLIAGWVFSSLKPKTKLEVVKVASSASAKAESANVDLTDVPVTGDSASLMGDKLTTCAASYLPKGTFGRAPDFSFLCTTSDPREGADKLRVAVVGAAPKGGGPSDAMKIFARIGWYDMAALAVIRVGCCPDAPPLHIEGLASTCPKLDEALEQVGKAVVDQQPTEAPLKTYTDAIHCELNLNHGTLLHRTQRPVGGEDTAFLELVKKL